MTRKQLQLIFIFLLIPISINFFEARFLSKSLVNYSNFLFGILAIVFSLPYMFMKKRGFVFPVQLMVLSIIISIFMANIAWGQSFTDSLKSSVPLLLWILFFFLVKHKIEVEKLEWIIIFYGFVYVVLYLYQFRHPQTVLFGGEEEFEDKDRGILRILFPGGGLFLLMSFMGLNKLTTEPRYKYLWLTISILGLVIVVMQVTRQAIFAVFLIYIFHAIRDLVVYKKVLILVSFVVFMFYIKDSDNPIVKGIIEAQTRDAEEGKENNIRYIAASYFLTEFAPNRSTALLGNGAPYALNSRYSVYLDRLADQYGFYLSDVGLVGLYVMFGVLAILAYLLIWYKSLVISIDKNYYYVKYYLWYLFLTSLTSNTVFHPNYLIATVIVLYIYQRVALENKPAYSKKPEPVFKGEPAMA